MMKNKIILITLFFIAEAGLTQINNDLIIEHIEKMSEQSGEEISDYSELIEAYWSITENPININSEDIHQLAEFKLLSIFQLEKIKEYRKLYGDIEIIDELYEIESLDDITIEMIKPLITISDKNNIEKISFKNIFKFGKSKILFEINQCLNQKEGYKNKNDSIIYNNLNSIYVGSSQRIYIRYNYTYKDRIEAGFVMEKDPGEYMFKNNINDSIKLMLGSQCYNLFDYMSFHLYLKNIGIIKTIAIGDYKLSFGQGLTMGSGVAFTAKGGSLLRQGKKITASKSANETNYLRGIASTIKYKQMELSIFYSNKKTDANILTYDSLDNKPTEISNLQQTGLHRTYKEILNRRVVTQQLYGFNLSYKASNFQIGYTLHNTVLEAKLSPSSNLYNRFNFKGKELLNQGIDFYYILKKISLYGEIAMSDNKGTAFLIGTTFQPKGYIDFTVLYRNYAKDYQCLYSNAFANGSNTRNESGFYFGSSLTLFANWKLITSFDYFKSEWFKTTAHAPSNGHNFDIQLNYQYNSNSLFFIEYNNRNKTENTSNTNIHQKYLVDNKKNMIRIHAAYNVNNNLTFKSRVEYHFNIEEENKNYSYMIYQDILYNPKEKPYDISFRYELFNSEEGSVYAHENDILYAFAVGGLSGKGIRTYLVGKIKILNSIQFSTKIAFTIYDNKNIIGSGLETISNNWRGDIKFQIVWTL